MALVNIQLTPSYTSVISVAENVSGALIQVRGGAAEICFGEKADDNLIGIAVVGTVTIPPGVEIFAKGSGTLIASSH
ncbi:hypothetical protein BO117_RS13665 [Escherichia coli]|nr:hypothetical protein [Escherichia coli]